MTLCDAIAGMLKSGLPARRKAWAKTTWIEIGPRQDPGPFLYYQDCGVPSVSRFIPELPDYTRKDWNLMEDKNVDSVEELSHVRTDGDMYSGGGSGTPGD